MNKQKMIIIVIFMFLLLMQVSSLVSAQTTVGEHDDLEIFNLEIEKLLNFGSGMLALILSYVTLTAYRRTKQERLLYVTIAFLLFAIKGFLTAHELFFEEWSWVDPVASVLNFVILLTFFIGIVKK